MLNIFQRDKGGIKAKYKYWSQKPPMDTLRGSSCPPPNASNESAKAESPLNASPRAALLKKQNKKSATFL